MLALSFALQLRDASSLDGVALLSTVRLLPAMLHADSSIRTQALWLLVDVRSPSVPGAHPVLWCCVMRGSTRRF